MRKVVLLAVALAVLVTACGPRSDETSPEMAQSLLKARGFSFTEDEFFRAIRQNEAANVKLFLQAGIDANARNKAGETALTFAAVNSNEAVIKALAEKADLNLADKSGNTPIFIALKKEKFENFNALLDKGADANGTGTAGNVKNQSVLYVAVLVNKTDIVKKLIDKGAKPDLADSDGSIPITEQVLALRPNMDVFKMLLEKSQNINIQDRTGSTVLMYAAKNEKMPREIQTDLIRQLLAKGADKNLKDKEGKTALAWAVERKNTEAAALLK